MTCDAPDAPSKLDAAARQAVRSWLTAAPAEAHRRAAAAALAADSEAATDRSATAILARAVWRACPALVAAIVVPDHDALLADACGVRQQAGMLALDALLADYIAGLDPERAGTLRHKAVDRLASWRRGDLDLADLFKLWTNGATGALVVAAVTLWRALVAEQWKRAPRVVALPRPLVENMATTIAPHPRQLRLDHAGADALVRMRVGGQVIAQREADAGGDALLRALLAKGREGLSRLADRDALVLVLWIQSTVLLQRAADVPNYRDIHVAAPWREQLCCAAGLSEDARKNVAEYLHDFHAWHWPLPGYRTVQGLAGARETEGGCLVIEASRLLAGEWVAELRELGEPIPSALRAFVPLPFPVWDLSAVGPRLRRRAVAFLLRVWLELHEQAAELTQGPGVALDQRVLDLAEDCGMRREYGGKLLAHWRGRAYLDRHPDADQWTLGAMHRAEHAFLLEWARRSAAGSARYEKGLARKAAGLPPWRKRRGAR